MAEHEQTTSGGSDQQAFIAELSQIALTSLSLAALFDMTVQRVKEILKADFCEALEYDPQSQTLLLRAGVGWKKGLVGKAQFDAGVEWQTGYTLFSDNPVVVADLSQERRFHGSPQLSEHGIRSGISVTIKGYEHAYGVLGVYSRKRRHFNLGEANFVQSTANILAGFIQRSSIETELRNLNASLELQVEARTRLLRWHSRERLRESELRTMEAQHLARLGSWEWDLSGQKVSCSPELFRIFALAEDEFAGTYQAFLDRIHPDDLERAQSEFQRAFDYGIPFNFQHRIVRPGGELRVVQNRGRAMHNRQDQPVRIIGTAQDITEMVAIENHLQAQDELLENVLVQSQVILWSIDCQGELCLSRRGGLAALGVPSGDQLGVHVFEILPQDHPLAGYLGQALGGTVVQVDFKVDERTYDLRILPQVDPQGEVTGVNGIAFDITRRIETEQALRKSEQNYRLVVENVQDYAIFSLDRQGYVTSWNLGATRVKGYQASEIIGKHYSIFFTPEDRTLGMPQKALQIALREGKFEAESWRVRKAGTKFWANTLLYPFKDENGELLGYTKMVRDFTSRREAEQALQESETRFRSIFEFGALGIALLDLKGKFLLANPSLQKMLKFQEQELLAHSLKSLSYPFDAFALMAMFAEVAVGKDDLFRQESRFQRQDKQIVWVSLTFSLVRDAHTAPAFVIGLFEDITYRKRMEAELREIKRQLITSEEKQRLYLAQELHDDPMQELYGVFFQLETLDVGTPQEPASLDELQSQIKLAKDTVEKVIQRLRVMCGQLRPINLAPFGLEGAIREHMDKFKEEHPNLDVKLELTYDGQLLSEEVRISLFRIYQQAMGNIIRHAQADHVVVRFYYDHQKVSLEVEDDGVGFEVPPSLFRLARKDHLGIAGAAERAELLGGKLTIRSEPGKGTLVHAVVPLQPFDDPAL